jgi:propanol-preferring alcohol dehydrogenase
MSAYRLPGWGRALELVELAIPTPRGREVLVEVQAVGLCHSDLFVMSCDEGVLPYDLPLTLGHEVAGRVVAGGDESDLSLVGRSGVVHGVWSCGECHNCRNGRDNYCVALEGKVGCGLGRDGGLAHYVLLPDARHFVVADTVSPVVLAPLADAGLTSHHAIRSLGDAPLGDSTVLLIGVGGLGHLAVQILRATTSAQVIAVDPRPEARALASELGAQQTAATIDEALAPGSGVDVVLDFVGSDETMRQGAAGLVPGGRLVVVGGARGSLVVGKGLTLPLGWQVSAPFWGSRADLVAVVELAEKGLLEPVVEVVSFDEVPQAYQRLHDGGVTGRLVVSMDGAA